MKERFRYSQVLAVPELCQNVTAGWSLLQPIPRSNAWVLHQVRSPLVCASLAFSAVTALSVVSQQTVYLTQIKAPLR